MSDAMISRPFRGLKRLRALLRDSSAVAITEFALSLPVLLIFGLGGIEVANYTLTHMRVSQLAVSLADNASRAKEDSVSGTPRFREYDVNQSFLASELQSSGLNLETNGRLILSSLEVNDDGGQWIHWQRCYGDAPYASSYGVEGDGESGTGFAGMGPADRRVTAEDGYAIMVAEVIYDYEPVALGTFIPDSPIRKFAAMYVRDDRDLSQVYNPAPAVTVSSCS